MNEREREVERKGRARGRGSRSRGGGRVAWLGITTSGRCLEPGRWGARTHERVLEGATRLFHSERVDISRQLDFGKAGT